jgi:hypothetical protein
VAVVEPGDSELAVASAVTVGNELVTWSGVETRSFYFTGEFWDLGLMDGDDGMTTPLGEPWVFVGAGITLISVATTGLELVL